jgi:hypothetical protein
VELNFRWLFPNRTRERNLPSLEDNLLPEIRTLSTEEIHQLHQKERYVEKEKHQESVYNIARITLLTYFSMLILLSSSILVCNLKKVNSEDMKWLTGRFLETSSPLVVAVVFYYFGKTDEEKKL